MCSEPISCPQAQCTIIGGMKHNFGFGLLTHMYNTWFGLLIIFFIHFWKAIDYVDDQYYMRQFKINGTKQPIFLNILLAEYYNLSLPTYLYQTKPKIKGFLLVYDFLYVI